MFDPCNTSTRAVASAVQGCLQQLVVGDLGVVVRVEGLKDLRQPFNPANFMLMKLMLTQKHLMYFRGSIIKGHLRYWGQQVNDVGFRNMGLRRTFAGAALQS